MLDWSRLEVGDVIASADSSPPGHTETVKEIGRRGEDWWVITTGANGIPRVITSYGENAWLWYGPLP